MNIGHVAGGTNAGWRRTAPQPEAWTCPTCKTPLKRYYVACPDDRTPRPNLNSED